MGDFTKLLGDLDRTCRELEQIKAQQTKDHERVSRSFEKTLLCILKQEQSLLNLVEEEHRRLRDQLSSIQKDNELALHNGVCEINSMVQQICNVSSQLKQALVASSNHELVMRQIQGTLSNIFSKKNGINISLKKVHFTPRPLQATTLGEIRYEEQTLGFSVPCLNTKIEPNWCKKAIKQAVLLSDETPPWEDQPQLPGVSARGKMEDDSDQESLSTRQSSVELKRQQDLSPRDPAVLEADSAALSPQVATKIWVTDSKNTAPRMNKKPQGAGTAVANGNPAQKASTQQVARVSPRKEQRPSSTKRQPRPQGSGETLTQLESEILSNLQETQTKEIPEHNTLFRATAAYVWEDDSEGSEEIVEDLETGSAKDPKACRQLALTDSRVPSAKRQSDGEPAARWNPTGGQPNEDSGDGNQQHTTPPPPNRTAPGIDYMRMSDETSDSYSGDFLNVPPRPCSPSESVESSYTFIIESPKKTQTRVRSATFSRSSNPIGRKIPVIPSKPQDGKTRTGTRNPGSWKTAPRSTSLESSSRPRTAPSRVTRPASAKDRRDSVSSSSTTRSVAASAPSQEIRVRSAHYCRKQRPPCLSRSEPNLADRPPDGTTRLLRQFGKFGSGRAELNLPHGLCATSSGSIYIVDYGNRRLQVMDVKGKLLQQFALEDKNYFDVAVSRRGLVALTNSSDRSVDVYSKHGRLLHVLSRNWGAPRGIAATSRDDFIVADMRLGVVSALTLDPGSGRQKGSTVVPGFNKPYLVATNSQGLLAVSERGPDGGCCVKVLGEDWQLLKVLGLRSAPGPALCNPWGVSVDGGGGVLVVDWAQTHRIIHYPPRSPGRVVVSEGLSSPRGLVWWSDGRLLVADSMNNCIKLFQYRDPED